MAQGHKVGGARGLQLRKGLHKIAKGVAQIRNSHKIVAQVVAQGHVVGCASVP